MLNSFELIDISTQDKGFYLFDVPKKFSLSPDIVIKKEVDMVILDTKWKLLINNERMNYGVSQADMYQMYAYAKKYNAKKVLVLYPLNQEMNQYFEQGITFRSEDILIKLLFIDLINIDESIINLKNEIISLNI